MEQMKNDLARVVAERLRALKVQGVTEELVGARSSPPLKQEYVNKVANGRIPRPGDERLAALAVGLGLPAGALRAARDRLPLPAGTPADDFPPDDVAVPQASPSPVGAPASFTMLAQSPKRPRGVVATAWVTQNVPLVQQRLHAGDGRPDDPESLLVAVPRVGNYLCMRVVGECMLPDIEPDDIVILDQDMAVAPNWIAAIAVGGETRLTRMVRRDPDEWEFAPDNPAFTGMVAPANRVDIIGVVVARQKGPGVRPSPRVRPSPPPR